MLNKNLLENGKISISFMTIKTKSIAKHYIKQQQQFVILII